MAAPSRSVFVAFLSAFVLSAVAACGPTGPGLKQCGPESCEGCCTETGDCLAGTAVFECGAGGGACLACEANQVCSAGSCHRFLDGGYEAAFPDAPDASVRLDAGTYVAPDGGAQLADAGVGDAGPMNVSYANQVQPIFDSKCDACHSWGYDTVVNQNSRVVPGNLGASALYQRTLSGDMPRSGGPLTSTQQNLLRDWILNGAPRN